VFYPDDINILGGSVYTVKKIIKSLVFASKQIGLEIKADKTQYMFMYQDQDADELTI
jgi:hypothetical protein